VLLVEFLVESEDGVVPVEVKAGNSATFDVSKLDFGNIPLRK